ncbi:MAG: class I SAM-dependent methyltransferase [Patescibacteria group bacterium]
MKSTPSLLREAEHQALSRITLSGSVLDLGGEKGSEYLSYLQGDFTVTALNLDEAAVPDIFHDLEKPLPIPDESYDHVLLINVLEHIFDYRQLLTEAVRVVRPGGSIVIVVPFLFPIHPSPSDFWRFSGQTLERLLTSLDLEKVSVHALGSGVFSARYVMLDRLLPTVFRFVGFYTLRPLTVFADRLFVHVARMLGKKYRTEDYALGYCAVARR